MRGQESTGQQVQESNNMFHEQALNFVRSASSRKMHLIVDCSASPQPITWLSMVNREPHEATSADILETRLLIHFFKLLARKISISQMKLIPLHCMCKMPESYDSRMVHVTAVMFDFILSVSPLHKTQTTVCVLYVYSLILFVLRV